MDITEVLWGIAAVVLIVLNYSAPLPIQLLLYTVARRMFRKAPDAAVYAVCLAVTTALLYPLYLWNMTPLDPDPTDKFDAFDGLITLCFWAPWYLGIVIAGIVKLIRQIKPKTHTEHDRRIGYDRRNQPKPDSRTGVNTGADPCTARILLPHTD